MWCGSLITAACVVALEIKQCVLARPKTPRSLSCDAAAKPKTTVEVQLYLAQGPLSKSVEMTLTASGSIWGLFTSPALPKQLRCIPLMRQLQRTQELPEQEAAEALEAVEVAITATGATPLEVGIEGRLACHEPCAEANVQFGEHPPLQWVLPKRPEKLLSVCLRLAQPPLASSHVGKCQINRFDVAIDPVQVPHEEGRLGQSCGTHHWKHEGFLEVGTALCECVRMLGPSHGGHGGYVKSLWQSSSNHIDPRNVWYHQFGGATWVG